MTSNNSQPLQEIISRLSALAAIAMCVWSNQMAAQALAVDVGSISELNGQAEIVRDKQYEAAVDLDIKQNDEAITKNGRMAITFLDDSVVKLTEFSQLLIDEYIYDPDPSKSKMALTFASGTTRFITSKLGLIDKQNIKLKTPTADIVIRGTDFTATVDELGRSLIILLPDEFGISSGEIEVITASGSVLLNKPYQATTVDVFENPPSKPVILDLTLDIIDNILIVSPPKEVELIVEEEVIRSSDSILDFNDLDIDYLEEDFLDNESDLEFTELDINYLDVNFLEDLLDVIDALQVEKEEDALAQTGFATNVEGTRLGQDLETGIITFITGDTITLQREVSQYVRVDLNVSQGYTVLLIQDGVSRVVKINGGGSSTITITQGSG